MGASKLNRGTHAAIVDAVRRGNYYTQAARLAHVGHRTLRTWMKTGREESEAETPYSQCVSGGKYRRLWEDMQQAEAEFEDNMIQLVAQAAQVPQNWAAAMTILERKYPDRYGRRETVQIEGGDQPLIALNVLNDPTTRQLLGDLLRRVGSPSGDVITGGPRVVHQLESGDPDV